MTTKPQTFLRLLLIGPYLAWGMALLFVSLVSVLDEDLPVLQPFFEALTGIAAVYTIGIVIWGIPYTILAVGLLVWSIHKPAPTIYKVFLFSPFLLSILTVIEVTLISYLPPRGPFLENWMEFLWSVLLIVIAILLFGYVFVGASVVIYKAMLQINFIKSENY